MGAFRRFGIFALCTAALIGGGIWAGRLFPNREKAAIARPAQFQKPDTSGSETWRKRYPWLYSDSTLIPYRDAVLRPLVGGDSPRGLRKHAGYLEAVMPRGRPVHDAAWTLESLCAAAGVAVLEGRELDPPGERVEYRLQAPNAPPLTLRLSLGKAAQAGAARLALVIVGLDSARDGTISRLLAFPIPLTLVVNTGDSANSAARWRALPRGKEILLELPMEPAAYPYVKPGPGALFIHHSREEVERNLDAKLRRFPAAKGFATTFGDRAIENRPLLENVLRHAARHSRLFLDLTGSPRSLTASAALKTGAVTFTARVQEFQGAAALETDLARRCALVQKAGEGIWVLRYAPALPATLEKLLREHADRFEEMGLEWVPLGALRAKK